MLTSGWIALVAVSFLGLFGWIAAWHARGRALDAYRQAQRAGERSKISEAKTTGIQMSELAQRNIAAAAGEQLAVERVRSSSIRIELETARADLRAMGERVAQATKESSGEELYDSTTKRLRNPAALVTHKPS